MIQVDMTACFGRSVGAPSILFLEVGGVKKVVVKSP